MELKQRNQAAFVCLDVRPMDMVNPQVKYIERRQEFLGQSLND